VYFWGYWQIEYKGKGYFYGKSHSFKAVVWPTMKDESDESDESFTIEGTWNATSNFSTGESFHDVTGPKQEVTVRAGGRIVPNGEEGESGEKEGEWEMGEWETRRLWAKVANGIREGDFETASREKSRIEVSVPIFSSI
jgi:oxysterol-binding protein-related protein 9/10/11